MITFKNMGDACPATQYHLKFFFTSQFNDEVYNTIGKEEEKKCGEFKNCNDCIKYFNKFIKEVK